MNDRSTDQWNRRTFLKRSAAVGALGAALMAPRPRNALKPEQEFKAQEETRVQTTTFLDRLLRWKA